jgi:hypothetical protein
MGGHLPDDNISTGNHAAFYWKVDFNWTIVGLVNRPIIEAGGVAASELSAASTRRTSDNGISIARNRRMKRAFSNWSGL